MKNTLLVIILSFTMLNCQTKSNEEGLILEVINKEVVAYCPNKDCQDIMVRFDDKEYSKSNNIIKLKLSNLSQETFVLLPIFVDEKNRGNYSFPQSFPDRLIGLSLNNVTVVDNSNGETLKTSYLMTNREYGEKDRCYELNDSINKTFYNKIGYANKNVNWKMLNALITNELIVIHPKEILYFDTFAGIPINYNYIDNHTELLPIDFNGNYEFSLIFNNSIDDIYKHLIKSQEKTFKENGYVLYEKDLKSNSIPIIFKE